MARASIVSNDNATTWAFFPSYAGSTSNTVYAAFPQVELAASPGAPTSYKPTLATLYYGQPSITVGGNLHRPIGLFDQQRRRDLLEPPGFGRGAAMDRLFRLPLPVR